MVQRINEGDWWGERTTTKIMLDMSSIMLTTFCWVNIQITSLAMICNAELVVGVTSGEVGSHWA